MTIPGDSYGEFLTRGEFAELYLEESAHLSLRWEDRRLDDIVQGQSSGLGVRILKGQETFFGHMDCRRPATEGLRPEERKNLHGLITGLAGHLPASRRKITPKASPARAHPVRVRPQAISLENKVKLLERADAAARNFSSVHQVTVSYGERAKKIAIVNSQGEVVVEERTYVTLTVSVTAAKNGLLQTAYESMGGVMGYELFEKTPSEWPAELAAKRAVAKLVAPPAPLGEMPVVIAAEAGGTLIHEAIGHALEADGIQQGTSPHFANKIGKVVANERVTVLDDPTRPGHRGSFFYDDEGTPSEATVLVEKGVLKTYLFDRRTAKKAKRASNGHGRRESYAHKPIPRMSNTFIAPGKDNPEAIIRSMPRGLLVTRMGGGQVNTATGDFVFEVEEGHWLENGRVKHLVRGANLLGNGPEALRTIDRVGSDIGWSIGTCGKDGQGVPVSDGVPTLRIPKLVIGGTEGKK